jgi:2-polyprenyl-6-methoxyphenol hydroxylase-like FAD-dependent oxidoreductase
VLGAGIAGLVAARVLADYFVRVTIVERDHLPTEPVARTGIPQGQHIHVLLRSGRSILNRLFAGLEDALGQAGAPIVDGANDLAWLTPGGWAIRYPSTFVGRAATRPLLEWTIRQRLERHPRISVRGERTAVGVLASDDRRRVVGVRLRFRARDDGTPAAEENVAADLTVDATGRGSRAPQWLRDLGYPEPPRTEINAFLGYASRLYRLPDNSTRAWQGLYIQAKVPTDLRSGALFRTENDSWLCTLGGYAKDYPPTDEQDFLAFARGLRVPDLYAAIADAEPLTPLVANRSSANVWRHYEMMARWPEGFVALGDAVCAFNPVYGQGMSVAVKEALVLDACLRQQQQRRPGSNPPGLAQQFQRKVATSIRPVWTIATSADVQVPGVEGGHPSRADGFLHWYLDRVIRLATRDVFAREILLEVQNLDRPTTLLFHPRLVARVAQGLRG